jgi:lipid II:glycine glycyltransferase (peptidoglycan interpeptide bridge formation enzyme)
VTTAAAPERRPSQTVAHPTAWDSALRAQKGHLLQSWAWGAFKERFGWEVERIAAPGPAGEALAQVLFRRKAGVSIGYVPRGPVLPQDDADTAAEFWARLDEVARRHRTLTIIVEPDSEIPDSLKQWLRPAADLSPIQPSRSVKIELLDDQALIDQMHPKTRYNVRLARRRGVVIHAVENTASSIDEFYMMLRDTASRNAFVVHAPDYYREFLNVFGDDACLMFAEFENKRVAGAIAAVFGEEGIYMYGASSTRDRAHGAAFLLQHEIMRWARERGALRYDLWGIPDYDPESTVSETGDRLVASKGDDRRGLYEFKTRFGGHIVRYPAPLERAYHPFLASLARRFYSSGGSG